MRAGRSVPARRVSFGVSNDVVVQVQNAVRQALGREPRILLAVSGGMDSMCLLDAAAAVLPRERLEVATFDHGSGEWARRAVALVMTRARALGIVAWSGGGESLPATEAAWRQARWSFLRTAAARSDAAIATAHTRDDQLETVLMRVLRGTGARGLAALLAPSPVRRPLLEFSREELRAYAEARRVDWIDDPSNASPAFLRNRVRNDLLPALLRARPSLGEELLAIARDAAKWREQVERAADAVPHRLREGGAALDVARHVVAGYSRESLAVLWPALVARAGLVLDRRGTDRLTAFTINGSVGSRIQLSGGWEMIVGREQMQLRRGEGRLPLPEKELNGNTHWGRWRFRLVDQALGRDAWMAALPGDRPLSVRRWKPGDALAVSDGRPRRKVKRLLSSAGIAGHDRRDWPVVLAGDEIVWIPGVRRSDAATVRSGRPGPTYICEFDDR